MAATTVTIAAADAARKMALGYFDNLQPVGTTQAGAGPVLGTVNRVTVAAANGAVIMPSILNGDAGDPFVVVANESANTIQVFPFQGEKMNGVANAALTIAAGAVGIFIKVPNSLLPNDLRAGPDWRSAVAT